MAKIVELVTPTCSVCKMITPGIKKCIEMHNSKTDDNIEYIVLDALTVGAELAEKYNVKTVPVFIINDGETVYTGAVAPIHLINAANGKHSNSDK